MFGWYKAMFVVSGGNMVFGVVSMRFGVIFGRFGVVWGVSTDRADSK